jgi:type II secretory pathway component PulK
VTSRRGFAMITILWVLALAAAMAGVAALTGRNAVNATRNRAQAARAYWLATGCATRVRALIDDILSESASFEEAAQVWRVLGHRVAETLPAGSECTITLEAAGSRLDVNEATDEMLDSLLRALGYDTETSATMTDALIDWRDSDDVIRPLGAERAWYDATRRERPRDASLADINEISFVRGFETAHFDSVMSVDRGRISLATAPVTVLLSVPGFTRETAETIVALQRDGRPISDLLSLLGMVSEASRSAMLARYPDISRLTTPDPDAWIVTVRGAHGLPAIESTLRMRLQRIGKRAILAELRSTM